MKFCNCHTHTHTRAHVCRQARQTGASGGQACMHIGARMQAGSRTRRRTRTPALTCMYADTYAHTHALALARKHTRDLFIILQLLVF